MNDLEINDILAAARDDIERKTGLTVLIVAAEPSGTFFCSTGMSPRRLCSFCELLGEAAKWAAAEVARRLESN